MTDHIHALCVNECLMDTSVQMQDTEMIDDRMVLMQDEDILHEIFHERRRQEARWGQQDHPDGTGTTWIEDLMPFAWREDRAAHIAFLAKKQCEHEARIGKSTWRGIALEEIAEAFAETDPVKLRAELVQAAAVLVNWIGAIDRRKKGEEE